MPGGEKRLEGVEREGREEGGVEREREEGVEREGRKGDVKLSGTKPRLSGHSWVVSCPPHGEKRSGKQSQISWAHSQKVVRTNEIVRSVILCSTSLTTVKFLIFTRVSVPF